MNILLAACGVSVLVQYHCPFPKSMAGRRPSERFCLNHPAAYCFLFRVPGAHFGHAFLAARTQVHTLR